MSAKKFEDLLEPRRRELSNYFYINRALNPQVAVQISPRPSPQSHQEAVLNSKKISELVTEISQKQNVKREEIVKQLRLILEEIGYKKNLQVIRYLGYLLTKIFLKVSTGVYVNHQGISQIKSQMGKCPVVFVPTHRSYADFIVFSYVMFAYDIEIPAIAAGMDFQGMMGMGEMLRNTGAFFMRRSYNDDSLYWSAFKEYVNQLVSKGDLPLEFFIEGTRSRSNKSIVPKYGLFNMILKSFFLSQVPDILFVPVNVSYDRILEESLFAFELLGIPKPKESTSGFFKSLTILKESFGNIYFNFGEPISTRSFFQHKSQHSFGSIHLHETSEEEKKLIPPLAYEIIRRQQLCTVVTYTNLISLILSKNLTRGQQYTGFEQLGVEIGMWKQILQSWGATIFEKDVGEAIRECLKVQQKLLHCDENGNIGLVTNKISVGKLNPSKLKAHVLSEDTISYSVPFIMLQLYANPILHYFVDAALIVIVLRSFGKMIKDELFKHYCTLRAIFSYEFVLLESWFKMRFEDALLKLKQEKIISLHQNGLYYDVFENKYFEEVLISSVQPFLLSYYVVTVVLETVSEMVDEKTILVNVQSVLENALRENKIFIHPYCLTLDTLGNCLMSLAKNNIVKKTRRNNINVYDVNREAVRKLKANLEIYIPAFHVIKSFDMFLHLKSKI
ncbi:unnamed protein product [Ceutorhynchus assimilis]|uniref:Phospholipid/glycerol acyltransferase domain-containing protein n=1 Tax=Ceutorhynchus assimilis TaxID=467358 RepID=A0A9N9MDB3_9CUCU|nr:unnamed protein product [Ceutorhynchus assimilis]